MGDDLPKKALAPQLGAISAVKNDDGFDKAAKYTELCESLKLDAYLDSGGVWTIGIGATRYLDGSPVRQGDKISEPDARKLFRAQFKTYWDRCANNIPGWDKMHSGQRAALASLAYNDGYRYKDRQHDTLDSAIEAGEPFGKALLLYNKVYSDAYPDGKVELGLSRRRHGEALMASTETMSAELARKLAWAGQSVESIESKMAKHK